MIIERKKQLMNLLLVVVVAGGVLCVDACAEDTVDETSPYAWPEHMRMVDSGGSTIVRSNVDHNQSVEVGETLTCSGGIGSEPEELATRVTLQWSRFRAFNTEDIVIGEPVVEKTAEITLTLTDENVKMDLGGETAEEICCSISAETETGDFLFHGGLICARLKQP